MIGGSRKRKKKSSLNPIHSAYLPTPSVCLTTNPPKRPRNMATLAWLRNVRPDVSNRVRHKAARQVVYTQTHTNTHTHTHTFVHRTQISIEPHCVSTSTKNTITCHEQRAHVLFSLPIPVLLSMAPAASATRSSVISSSTPRPASPSSSVDR